MPETAPPADLLTAAEAAARKGVQVTTINKWVARGKLVPAHEYPGKVRVAMRLFRPEDIDAIQVGAA